MIRATALTSTMDEYDSLKPVLPQDGAEVDWVCLTDSKRLRAEAEHHSPSHADGDGDDLRHPTGWRIVWYDRPADEHPNRAAKKPKTHPASFTDAPFSVWLDASFRMVSPRFVVDVVTIARESDSGIAQFVHPWRNSYFVEAAFSSNLPKYAVEQELIERQAIAYCEAGMPDRWGLWATGVIARRHDPAVLDWGHRWAKEIDAYSYQDQISHPFVCWSTGLRPVDLPGDHFHNHWLEYQGSERH